MGFGASSAPPPTPHRWLRAGVQRGHPARAVPHRYPDHASLTAAVSRCTVRCAGNRTVNWLPRPSSLVTCKCAS